MNTAANTTTTDIVKAPNALRAKSTKQVMVLMSRALNLKIVLDARVKNHCAKCGAELTDQASVEFGVGPECRKKANAILAREFTTNPDAVTLEALLMGCHADTKPEPLRSGWLTLQKHLLEPTPGKRDYRDVVGLATQLCSLEDTAGARVQLFQIIAALGYRAYAGYLEGTVSANENCRVFWHTFPSTHRWTPGKRLCFQGIRNPRGNDAIKTIPGRAGHAREVGAIDFCWSVPPAKAADLVEAVRMYWPLTNLSEFAEFLPKPAVVVTAAPNDTQETPTMTDKQLALMNDLAIEPRRADGYDTRVINACIKMGYVERDGLTVKLTEMGQNSVVKQPTPAAAAPAEVAKSEPEKAPAAPAPTKAASITPKAPPVAKEGLSLVPVDVTSCEAVKNVMQVFPGAVVNHGTEEIVTKKPHVTVTRTPRVVPIAPRAPKAAGEKAPRVRTSPALIAFVRAVAANKTVFYVCNTKGAPHHDGMVVKSAVARGLVSNDGGYAITDAGKAFLSQQV